MRSNANQVLAGVSIGFIAVLFLHLHFRDSFVLQLLFAVSESALVGGIADWFAVTALFRAPLGFPWHTALIPRNRAALEQTVVHMVQHELLNMDHIRQYLSQLRLVDLLIQQVDERRGTVALAGIITKLVQDRVETLPAAVLAERLALWCKRAARRQPVLPLLSAAIRWLVEHHQDQPLIVRLLDALIAVAEQPETRRQFQRYLDDCIQGKDATVHMSGLDAIKTLGRTLLRDTVQYFNIYNSADAAAVLQQELIAMLQDLQDGTHPLRLIFAENLLSLPTRIQADAALAVKVEKWKTDLLEQLDLQELWLQAIEVVTSFCRRREGQAETPVLTDWLADQTARYWQAFKNSPAMQAWLEAYLQRAAGHIAASEHPVLGAIVDQVLQGMPNDQLNQLVWENVGEDLEWIRINGSLIGGCAGLLLFLSLHFIYQPLLVPIVLKLFH